MRARILALSAVALLAFTGPAVASTWGGFNGVLRLAFDEAETPTQVLTAEPDSNGIVIVDLYAILDEVYPVTFQGEGFLGVGGFEVKLEIEGGGQIISQNFPGKSLNLSKTVGECMVGMYPTADLTGGRVTLIHWQVMFIGRPKEALFRLAEGWPPSCETVEGCPGSGTAMIYAGGAEGSLAGLFFSPAWSPAYLNWPGEPDTTPHGGKPLWSETGLFGSP